MQVGYALKKYIGRYFTLILTINVGNTNISIGGYTPDDKLLFKSVISTQSLLTADEYAIKFMDILKLNDCKTKNITGVAISNVVTPLSSVIKLAVRKLTDEKIIVVGPGIKTGINIKTDDPAVLGADLVCLAVGALKKYNPPSIIIELGTATVISAIDSNRLFRGTSIIPGMKISLKALSNACAQLPDVEMNYKSGAIIGTNTVHSMQSGIIISTACMLDGMILRFKELIGSDAIVICTGEYAKLVIPHCKSDVIHDETLDLYGLNLLYKKNA